MVDAVSVQYDVDYSSCAFRKQKYGEDEKKCKNSADQNMVQSLESISWKKYSGGMDLCKMQ